eukprot:292219_1
MSNRNGKLYRHKYDGNYTYQIAQPPKKKRKLNPNKEGISSIKLYPVHNDQSTAFMIENPSSFYIGSDESKCVVTSYHPAIAPLHAEVSFDQELNTVFIQALDPTKSVFVNAFNISDLYFTLQHGDTIRLGSSTTSAISSPNPYFTDEYKFEIMKNDTIHRNETFNKRLQPHITTALRSKWFYTVNGKDKPRVSTPELLELIHTGTITEKSYVWHKSHCKQWTPVHQVPFIMNQLQSIRHSIRSNSANHMQLPIIRSHSNSNSNNMPQSACNEQRLKRKPNQNQNHNHNIKPRLQNLNSNQNMNVQTDTYQFKFKKSKRRQCQQRNASTNYKRHVQIPKPPSVISHIVSPFVPHMKYHETLTLNVSHRVDVRDKYGQWFCAQIIGKNAKTLRVHYNERGAKYEDLDCRYKWKRFAKYGSIAKRHSKRFDGLTIGNYIDCNVMEKHPGWRFAQIITRYVGQIQVEYVVGSKRYRYWIHADDREEIAPFMERTGVPRLMDAESLFFESLRRSDYEIKEVRNVSDNDSIYEAILKKKLNGQDRESVEQYLWHGTRNVSNLEYILKNGFDRSFNSKSKFGKGTYFAKHASYSVGKGYCGRDAHGVSYIVLCKVIVGDYTIGTSDMEVIAKKQDGSEYDSLVNTVDDPTVFVVWRDYHAVPYRVVKFVSK